MLFIDHFRGFRFRVSIGNFTGFNSISKLQTEFSLEFRFFEKLRKGKFIGKAQNIITVKSRDKRFNALDDVYEMFVNKFVSGSEMRSKCNFGAYIHNLLVKIVQKH